MGMVKLLSDNDAGTTTNHYAFTMAGSADELTPKCSKGNWIFWRFLSIWARSLQ